jgi:phosphoglycerol transferase MdoB-like AlkP superfamily enzyme
MKWGAETIGDGPPRAAVRSLAGLSALKLLSYFALTYVLLISWLDPALPWPVTFSSAEPWLLALLNVVPILILNALFLVVTRRVAMACWLTLLVIAALYFVNHLKMQELATPLLPDDFHFLRAIGVNYAFFSQYLESARQQALIALFVVAITLFLLREATVPSLKGASRAWAAVASVALASTLVFGASPWNSIYNAGRLQFEPWAPLESASRTGLITNLLLFYWELRDDTAASQLTNAKLLLRERDPPWSAEAAATDENALPDIVIVQSESLFDPRQLQGVDLDAIPHMRTAAARGWSGDLHVPTFGGGTIRTEFEVLTGLPLSAFPRVRYPYLQMTRTEVPGLVRELAGHGYRTTAIHPNGGTFWNRNAAFRAFGFDRFIDIDGFKDAERYGWYVGDAALIDKVIEEASADGPPQLILAISIQNHGPYDAVPLPQRRERRLDIADLDAAAGVTLQTYVDMVAASDAALGRLVEWADARERHTLVLVYGDHLPPLNTVFAQIPFRDGRPAQEQPVPWVLIDNRSHEARIQHHASWYLPTVLLERAGIARSPYFAMLERIGREAMAQCGCFHADPAVQALAQLQYSRELESFLAETGGG